MVLGTLVSRGRSGVKRGPPNFGPSSGAAPLLNALIVYV